MTDLLTAVRHLQELQEAGTPLPWRLHLDDPEFPWVVLDAEGRGLSHKEDAALIVAAVNLVGPLIDDWERRGRIEDAARKALPYINPSERFGLAAQAALRAALALPGEPS